MPSRGRIHRLAVLQFFCFVSAANSMLQPIAAASVPLPHL